MCGSGSLGARRDRELTPSSQALLSSLTNVWATAELKFRFDDVTSKIVAIHVIFMQFTCAKI